MKRQIEIPVWLLLVSAALHLFTVLGLVAMLVLPGLAPKVVTVIEIRVTATPEPVQPTATALPPTATVVQPTATALPPTATRRPTATPVPCKQGEVPGVDCPLDVGGLAVTVVGLERTAIFTDPFGQEWEPRDGKNEVLIVHLVMPAGTVKSDLDVWFEDGGVHAPTIVDETGRVYDYATAYLEEGEDFGVAIIFAVPRSSEKLTLVFPNGVTVDLSLVTDITVEVVETPTPAPTSTSIFNP